MNNINFNDGFKEYTINNDPNKVIRFNPSDFNIINRIAETMTAIEKIAEEMSKSDIPIKLDGTAADEADSIKGELTRAGGIAAETDRRIKEQINYIFGSDVCSVAIGDVSCLASVGGMPLYQRFIEAFIPVIRADVEAEKKASAQRVEKYTKSAKKAGK